MLKNQRKAQVRELLGSQTKKKSASESLILQSHRKWNPEFAVTVPFNCHTAHHPDSWKSAIKLQPNDKLKA
jgi:hypothetical protein